MFWLFSACCGTITNIKTGWRSAMKQQKKRWKAGALGLAAGAGWWGRQGWGTGGPAIKGGGKTLRGGPPPEGKTFIYYSTPQLIWQGRR